MNASDLLLAGDRVLSALGNGLVQGLVLGLLVWAALKTMRSANAATRFAVEFAALLVVAALPVLHLLNESQPSFAALAPTGAGGRGGAVVPGTRPSPPADAPMESVGNDAPSFPSDAPVVSTLASDSDPVQDLALFDAGEPITPETDAVSSLSDSEETTFVVAELPGEAAAGFGVPVGTGLGEPEPEPGVVSTSPAEGSYGSLLQRASNGVMAGTARLRWAWDGLRFWQGGEGIVPVSVARGWSLTCVAAWLLVAGVRLLRLAIQMRALRGLKRDADAPSETLAGTFEEVRQTLGSRRGVRVGLHPDVSAPMIVGYLRPMILLPAEFAEANSAEVEQVLRHELAHLVRRDDWTNLVQQGIRAVLFFHPAVHWLSRRLTLDREIACDDHVLSATGRARDYALFLTEFARRNHGREWTTAPAAWSNPSQLKERIDMLLDTKRNASPRLARGGAGAWITAVLLLAVLGLYAAPRLAIAAPADEVTASDDAAGNAPDAPVVAVTVTTEGGTELSVTAPKVKPPLEPLEVIVTPPSPPALAVVRTTGTATPRSVLRAVTVPHAAPHRLVAAAEAPAPPAPPAAPAPAAPPTYGPPRPEGKGDALERRLERLEKLVESLARAKSDGKADAKPDPKPDAKPDGKSSGTSAAWSGSWNAKTVTPPEPPEGEGGHLANLRNEIQAKIKAGFEHTDGFESMNRLLDQVARQVDQAVREAERAVQSALKSTKFNFESQQTPDRREVVEARRKALDAERRALQKQIARVEAQLGRLDGQLDRVDDILDAEGKASELVVEHEGHPIHELRMKADAERAKLRAKAADKVRRDAERSARDAERTVREVVIEHGPDREKNKDKQKEKDKSGDLPPSPPTDPTRP